MKISFLTLAAASLVLAGCGSKLDPNETNFGAAISQYLDKKGDLCFGPKQWPVDVTPLEVRMARNSPTGLPAQMAALEAIGLATSENVQPDRPNLLPTAANENPMVKRYHLTDEGRKYNREREVERITFGGIKKVTESALCFGQKRLDKVVKWEGPIKLGDYQEASVKYLYKIDNLVGWAQKSELQTAFPRIKEIVDAAKKKEQTHAVKLTNVGWEPKGLD